MSKLKFNLIGDHKYTFTIQFSGGVDDVFVVVVVFHCFCCLFDCSLGFVFSCIYFFQETVDSFCVIFKTTQNQISQKWF